MSDIETHEPYLQPDDDEDFEHPHAARDFGNGVTLRYREQGVALFAVYDGDEQVSREVAGLQTEEIIAFAEGYASDTSEDRFTATVNDVRQRIDELETAYDGAKNETDAALTLARIEELRSIIPDDTNNDG